MKKRLFFLLLLSLPAYAQNNTDLYPFASTTQQQRFQNLTHELRCLVCQNQTLADSDAPLAKDMRQQIATMIQTGATDTEIHEFLVQRYGEFISYQPPFNRSTLLLWILPVVLVGGGLMIVWIRHRRAD
jgi:cytochrome c-type biogenesis protein CcmH